MRNWKRLLSAVAVVSLFASPVLAGTALTASDGLLSLTGMSPGYVTGAAFPGSDSNGLPKLPNGNPGSGLFGAVFAVPTMVDTFVINQSFDISGNRMVIKEVAVFADGEYVETITVPYGEGPQKAVLTKTVSAVQWNFVALSQHTDKGQGDSNGLLVGFSVEGTRGDLSTFANDNLHYDYVNGRARVDVISLTTPAHGGSGSGAVNGRLNDDYGGGGGVIWDKNAGAASLTVQYKTEELPYIGSVGIALTADHYYDRSAPKWVTISGGVGNQTLCSETVFLDQGFTQYGRYELTDAEWAKNQVEWLTITFPDATNTSDWYYLASSWGACLSEFQAFAHPNPIPEPATMTLLALGGLAILRRRR